MCPYASINDAELYYEIHGEEHERTLMVLHGGPGVSDYKKGLTAYRPLTEEYRLIVYDHRGCGSSSLTPPYSNEQFADDAEGLRKALDIDEVVLIGGSYGGFITQEYAIRYPDALAGIILRDTAAHGGHRKRAREIAASRFASVTEANLDTPSLTKDAFDRVMDGNVGSDEELRNTFHAMLPLYAPTIDDFDAEAAQAGIEDRQFHHETHNYTFTHEHPHMDYRTELPSVECPALVTVGRHDWITPVEYSEEIAELLPNSELVVFENSGHSPNLDEQEQFLKHVRSFLRSIGFTN
ncbi:alpha/beta fold hydrolase [Halalkalirubrum salinum]|uniref:alpha/beta fold hydrolase n=1 Tax=Halalkalirubrum salinum TaxID=2563889 RepID=UPI0010FB4F11|nr:alpha/beta hydrolase [Halalkalirubrum salinum]